MVRTLISKLCFFVQLLLLSVEGSSLINKREAPAVDGTSSSSFVTVKVAPSLLPVLKSMTESSQESNSLLRVEEMGLFHLDGSMGSNLNATNSEKQSSHPNIPYLVPNGYTGGAGVPSSPPHNCYQNMLCLDNRQCGGVTEQQCSDFCTIVKGFCSSQCRRCSCACIRFFYYVQPPSTSPAL